MLSINNLSRNFAGRFVFEKINYNFPLSGIIALVGANGAGKTTLLNILCGLDTPDDGSVNKAKSKTLGYLPQDPNPNPQVSVLEEAMSGDDELYQLRNAFKEISTLLETEYSEEIYERFERIESLYRGQNGYSFENTTSKMLLDLGFAEDQLSESPHNLSGGWKMRLELAKLLLKEPDFLILDEPTNHLDLPTITWLEAYLQKCKNTVLFVSHDESLLNRLPNIILHLKNGELNEYHGNYQKFLEEYELRESAKVATIKNLEGKINSAQRFVDRFGAKASKATQARSRMKMIAKLQTESSGIEVDAPDMEINIQIPLTQKSGKDVLRLDDVDIGYDRPLIKKLSLAVNRGFKIAIVGANGLGKSTILKTIIEQIPLLSGSLTLGHNVKIAYYAQDQHEFLDQNATVLENLKNAGKSIGEGKARSMLGSFLFRGTDVYKKTSVLSGGEKSRLSLACLMVQDANFLLLDEPTNHLDILSIEILKNALQNYPGTVLTVSHNRDFLNGVANHILAVSSDQKNVYLSEGSFDEFDLEKLN